MVQNEVIKVELGVHGTNIAAGTAHTDGTIVGVSGEKYEVLSVFLYPDAAITADPTNYSTYTLRNVTQSLDIASRSYAATNSVAATPEALTPTAAAKFVNGGDVLTWAKAETASGLAGRARCIVRLRRIL